MPFAEPDPAKILSNDRLRQTLAVRDWLLGEARMIRDPNVIPEGLALRLRAWKASDRRPATAELRNLGAFKLKGLDGEQTVFAPQAAASAALAEAAQA